MNTQQHDRCPGLPHVGDVFRERSTGREVVVTAVNDKNIHFNTVAFWTKSRDTYVSAGHGSTRPDWLRHFYEKANN